MVARSHHRGHLMYYDESIDEWRYSDDDSLVKDHWKERPCGKCGENFTLNGHDPCITNLPGVLNACCGHGDDSMVYVQFDGGKTIRGSYATDWIKNRVNITL